MRHEATKFPRSKHPALAQVITERGAASVAGAGHWQWQLSASLDVSKRAGRLQEATKGKQRLYGKTSSWTITNTDTWSPCGLGVKA